jgi:excisionase family DNA binding protein
MKTDIKTKKKTKKKTEIKTYYCVTSEFYKDGTVKATMDSRESREKPKNTNLDTPIAYCYIDWFGTQAGAEAALAVYERLGTAKTGIREKKGMKPKFLGIENPVRGQLLTIDEAAKYIRMGKTTFYDCINSGDISFFRPPWGKILLDTADLDDWLRMSKVPAGTVPGNI